MPVLNQFQKDMKRFGRTDQQVMDLQRARLALHRSGYDTLGCKVLVELKRRLRELNATDAARERMEADQLAGEARYRQSVLGDEAVA